MKGIKYIIFALILSILLIPNVFAKDSVEIKSITLDTKSDNTIIKSEPTFNGLVMNFDVSFKQKNDFVKYKVVVKNDSNIDYKIANDTSFNKSDHITYTYDVENILKPKGEAVVYVTITYSSEVDPSELVDGMYKEENKAVIQLLNKDGNVVNPNTGINYIIIISILLTLIIISILIKKHKKSVFIPVIIALLLIPTLVYAIETLKLTINVKVEIKRAYKVGYVFNQNIAYTESELEQYDTTRATCFDTYYLGSISPENKYIVCTEVLYEDNKLYAEGETVHTDTSITDLKAMIYKDYDSEPEIEYCQEQSNSTYLCDDRATTPKVQFNTWYYYKNYNKVEGYYSTSSDLMTMNFSSIETNKWNTFDEEISVFRNGTFTMPNHNVLFFINGRAR